MSTTSVLPLTTTFSPPADCTTDTWYVEYLSGSYYLTTSISASDEGWFLSQGPTDWHSCFPSGYKATTDYYYSPGICPSGYSVAKSSVLTIGSSSETRGTCCPENYTAQEDNGLVWYSTNRCFSDNKHPNHVWTFTQAGTITTKMTTGGINAKAVFIRWQETDFQTPTTTTTDSAAAGSTTASTGNTAVTSTPSATATAESNASVSSTATSNQGSEGSSSKAWIAGPVVGAVVACALIAFLATWYNRRKMRQQKSLPNPRNHMSELPAYQPEEFEARPPKVPVELPAYGT